MPWTRRSPVTRAASRSSFEDDGFLSVTDNGRGIPVDPHPKFKKKSALEVIMTTLHSGGKFNSKVYDTSGGLHGVGVSVVNALSETLEVEVARGQKLYRQTYTRGEPDGPLKSLGPVKNRRGTTIRFKPDPKIFGKGAAFVPARLFRMARSKAYLFGGVEIRWSCAAAAARRRQGHAAKRGVAFPRRAQGLSRRPHRGPGDRHQGVLHRQEQQARRPWRGRMGHRLGRRRGRLPQLLLQHRADARRRHA